MSDIDKYLSSVYFDLKHSGSYGGVARSYKNVKTKGIHSISREKIKE